MHHPPWPLLWYHHPVVLSSLWHKLLGTGETLQIQPCHAKLILGGSALSPSVGAGHPHAVEAPGRAASTHLGYK